jgi:hypothetical protein
MGVSSGAASGDSGFPIVLVQNAELELRIAVLVWAAFVLGLSFATEPLNAVVGNVGLALVWCVAVELIVAGALAWRRWMRSRPRLLLFREHDVSVIDREGRELARDMTEHVRVERGDRPAPPGSSTLRQSTLSLTVGSCGPIVIGDHGSPRRTRRAPLGTTPYLVGPGQWRSLLRFLGLDRDSAPGPD